MSGLAINKAHTLTGSQMTLTMSADTLTSGSRSQFKSNDQHLFNREELRKA